MILTGVVIATLTGENGILNRTSEATITSKLGEGKEKCTLIATLNTAAQSYMNTNLSPANGARCVGSSPSETPVTSEGNTGTYTQSDSWFGSYNYEFKPSSANNTNTTNEDYLQMKKSNINCYNISKGYWLASRHVGAFSSTTGFNICYVSNSGVFSTSTVCSVYSNGNINSGGLSSNLRPVFTLKSDIHYTDDGTTKTLVQ